MGNTEKPEVTAEELQNAQSCWVGFTELIKWGTIASIAGVVLLALITL